MQCSAKAYDGSDKYVFFSYCHKDKATVYPIIEQLVKDGCRIWYDEGITAGASWPEMIANHLDGCSVCICAVTKAFSKSHNCRNEMTFALENNIGVIALVLEDFVLPLGMRLQMANTQQVRLSECGYENIFSKLANGAGVKECFGEQQDIVVHTPADFMEDSDEKTPKRNIAGMLVKSMMSDRANASSEEEKARQEEMRRQADKARMDELRRQTEENARREAIRRQEEAAAQQEELRRQEDERARQEELRRQEEERARQEELRRQEEERARQEELRRQEEERARQEELRRQEEERARQEELRRQEEERARKEEFRRKAEEARRRLEMLSREPVESDDNQEEVTQEQHEEVFEPTGDMQCHLADSEDPDDEGVTVMDTGDDDDENTEQGHTVIEKRAVAPVLVHFETNKLYDGKYPMTSVGRSKKKCDIVLSDFGTVSSHHLDLIIYKKQNYIIDKGSANGTWVNGVQVEEDERTLIDKFAEVSIAHESFLVAFDELAEEIRNSMFIAVIEPVDAGTKQYLFGKELCMGRSHRWDENIFRSEKISRTHAVLLPCDDGYMIEDRSANGTFINKSKITKNEPVMLSDGDVIKMGSESFVYKCWNLEN